MQYGKCFSLGSLSAHHHGGEKEPLHTHVEFLDQCQPLTDTARWRLSLGPTAPRIERHHIRKYQGIGKQARGSRVHKRGTLTVDSRSTRNATELRPKDCPLTDFRNDCRARDIHSCTYVSMGQQLNRNEELRKPHHLLWNQDLRCGPTLSGYRLPFLPVLQTV